MSSCIILDSFCHAIPHTNFLYYNNIQLNLLIICVTQRAAYYASIGQTGTQAINSAPVAAAPAAAAAAGNQGQQHAPDHFYDDFFRYSYHYGEDAARQYYGAWSPPVGSVNPYGTNPAGTSSAAAAPKSENELTNSNGHDAANIRDSSVRNVSNLPAWMTKS